MPPPVALNTTLLALVMSSVAMAPAVVVRLTLLLRLTGPAMVMSPVPELVTRKLPDCVVASAVVIEIAVVVWPTVPSASV